MVETLENNVGKINKQLDSFMPLLGLINKEMGKLTFDLIKNDKEILKLDEFRPMTKEYVHHWHYIREKFS